MSGGFPFAGNYCNQQEFYTAINITGVSVTGGTASYSAWTQIIASTAYDVDLIEVYLNGSGSVIQWVDIGIGAGGSEVIIAKALPCFGASSYVHRYLLPLSIPSGSRVSFRCYNASGTYVSYIRIVGYSSSIPSLQGFSGIENVLAAGSVAALANPGVINTKGNYVQVIASTARDYDGVIPVALNCSASLTDRFYIDLSIGAAASETIIVPDLFSYMGTT